METISISKLQSNPNNPRSIKKDKLEKLKASIASFQEMMELRPIIVDENWMVLGGNQRYQAIKSLGLTEIPATWVKQVSTLTEEQKHEFIIKDNASFGEWDWEMLANEWDERLLNDWGLDLPDMSAVDEIEDKDKPESYPTITLTFFSAEEAQAALDFIEKEVSMAYPECKIGQSGF